MLANVEDDGLNSWAKARTTINNIKGLENPLTMLIRQIERSPEEFDSSARRIIKPILANAHYRSIVFYGLLTVFPEDYDETSSVEFREYLRVLSPRDHQAIATATIGFNLLKRTMNPDQLLHVDTDFQELGESGMVLGRRIGAIGTGMGLLLGIIRPLCFGLLSTINASAFERYIKHLKRSDILFDIDKEMDLFGCSHAQLAAMLLMRLGYSRQTVIDMYFCLDPINCPNEPQRVTVMKAAYQVITAVVKGESVIGSHAQFRSLLGEAYSNVFKELASRESKSVHTWLQKDASSLRKKNAPDILNKDEEESNQNAPVGYIPEKVLNEFTMEDIDSFRSMIADLITMYVGPVESAS